MSYSLPSRLRSRRRGRVLGYVVATLAVVAALGGGVWYSLGGSKGKVVAAPLTTRVIRADFDHSVVEQGEVESSVNVEIRCQVKSQNAGGTDILWVIPEGTIVQPGEELVKLDSSGLEKERDQQKIVCNTSLAIKVQAENTYKAALIARTEYLEGTFQQEKQTYQSEIFVAEENLRRAQQYARYSERLASRGYVTALQLEGDRFAVEKAKNELELAKRKLFVLEEYTREKMLRTLESDIASAKAKWEAEEESYKLELKKLADVEEQIAACTIKAPQAGQVVYANVANSRGGSAEFIVEPGAKVREGQTILRMPDTQNMQVRAKINESRITHVKAGQPVTIRIDALGTSPLRGVVKRVNSFAEPTSFFSSNVKQYGTEITILSPPPNIRTGLTAEVNIHVEQLADVVQVPIQTIIEHAGKTYALVQRGLEWEPREIKISSTNDKFARVDAGLEPEQIVAANPRHHLDLFPFIKNGILEPSPTSILAPAEAVAATNGPPSGEGVAMAAPSGRSGGERRNSSPADMFKRLDTDGDGKLSASELAAAPGGMASRLADADTNADGSIDQAELASALAKLRNGRSGGPPMPEGTGE